LTINKLQKKGTYSKAYVIKKVVDKAFKKPTKLKGIFATSENTEVGRWAKSKGYEPIKIKGGVKFVKTAYFVEKQKDGKTWKVFTSKADQTLLAQGVYTEKLQTLNIALATSVKKQQRERVLDALWKSLTRIAKKQVNVVYTQKNEDKQLFKGLSANASQEALNKKGQQTSIGHWAKAKGYPYTLLSRNNADNQILQVRFAKVACFVAGTQLDAIGGNKAIQDLKAYQDSVWAYDHTVNKRVLKVVTGTSQKQASALVTVATTKDTLYATPEHPFYLPQLKKYVPASELRQGNHLQLSNGTCAAITSTRWLDTLVTVYNISVAKHHNYFAKGVLVHNADCDTLWAKFAHYPKMNEVKAKVQGWKDTKLEKTFLKDMEDKNLAKKVFGEPDLVDMWEIFYKADEARLRVSLSDLEKLENVVLGVKNSSDLRAKGLIDDILTYIKSNPSKATDWINLRKEKFYKNFAISSSQIEKNLDVAALKFNIDLRYLSQQAKEALKKYWAASYKHLYRGDPRAPNNYIKGFKSKGELGDPYQHVMEKATLGNQSKWISTSEFNPFEDFSVTRTIMGFATSKLHNNPSEEGFVYFIKADFTSKFTRVKNGRAFEFFVAKNRVQACDVNKSFDAKRFKNQKEFAFEGLIPIDMIEGAIYVRFKSDNSSKTGGYINGYQMIGDFIYANEFANFDFTKYKQELEKTYGDY
uniref:Hint domain-containing protein n=1 Tax=uncultured Microscilla sp. TaxID=432653 RepID=UPI0026087303